MSPSSSQPLPGEQFRSHSSEVMAWLQECAVPATLLIATGLADPQARAPAHLLGKVYRGRISVLHLEMVGRSELSLQLGSGLILLLFQRLGGLNGSCGARPLHGRLQGLSGVLFPGERLRLEFPSSVSQLTFLCVPVPLLVLGSAIFEKPAPDPSSLDQAVHGFELALLPILDGFVRAPLPNADQLKHRQALAQLELSLISTILRLIPRSDPQTSDTPPTALVLPADRDLCDRADRWMRQNLSNPLDLDGIARACQCSKRSLQLAFRGKHDRTPMQHLRYLRLLGMQEQLLLGSTVGEASAAVGLPAVGRTSLQYFQQFGESPSATRSRAGAPADSVR